MLLMLVILIQVSAEWVEISQHHYRKPLRTQNIHNPFLIKDKIETKYTTEPWEYNNKTVTNNNWNNIPATQPSTAKTKRVQLFKNAEADTENEKHQDFAEDEFQLELNYDPKIAYSASGIQKGGKQKGVIKKIPNRGNVKRVKLNNSVVKSPVMNMKSDNDKILNDRYEEFPLDDGQDEAEEYKTIMTTKLNNRRIYLNSTSNQYDFESTSTISTNEKTLDQEIHFSKWQHQYKNLTDITNKITHTPIFLTKTEEFTHLDKPKHIVHENPQEKPLSTMKSTDLNYDIVTKNNYNNIEQITAQPRKNIEDKTAYTEQPLNKITRPEHDSKYKSDNVATDEKHELKKEIQSGNEEKENMGKEGNADNKKNNTDHLMKLLKVVANTLSQNSRRSLGGKMRYLHELKDSLLANIAHRIDSTWPDDTPGPRRSSRSPHPTPRGHHVQFPSSESALMTISFLTFAVFLIKLVLQLINTYKNKAMMVAPVMIASASRTAPSHTGYR